MMIRLLDILKEFTVNVSNSKSIRVSLMNMFYCSSNLIHFNCYFLKEAQTNQEYLMSRIHSITDLKLSWKDHIFNQQPKVQFKIIIRLFSQSFSQNFTNTKD